MYGEDSWIQDYHWFNQPKFLDSPACYSNDRCLLFELSETWYDDSPFWQIPTQENGGTPTDYETGWPWMDKKYKLDNYITLNMNTLIMSENEATDTIEPYSSLKVTFMMKTSLHQNPGSGNVWSDNKNPAIEVGLIPLSHPSALQPGSDGFHIPYGNALGLNNSPDLGGYYNQDGFARSARYFPNGTNNSNKSTDDNVFGAATTFQNSVEDTWEKMEFTFNITEHWFEGRKKYEYCGESGELDGYFPTFEGHLKDIILSMAWSKIFGSSLISNV